LRAEDFYTELLRHDWRRAKPGARLSLTLTVADRAEPRTAALELRPNAVWRFGRAFFRCPACDRLSTRLYLPTVEAPLRCRRCWGLSYESRQLRGYSLRSRWGPLLSPRAGALVRADDARIARAEAAAKRRAERREILRDKAGRMPELPLRESR
jgi:hypothetical protein